LSFPGKSITETFEGDEDEEGTAFLYTPGIGVRFSNLEVEAKYEGWSKNGTLSFFGIRVGYFF